MRVGFHWLLPPLPVIVIVFHWLSLLILLLLSSLLLIDTADSWLSMSAATYAYFELGYLYFPPSHATPCQIKATLIIDADISLYLAISSQTADTFTGYAHFVFRCLFSAATLELPAAGYAGQIIRRRRPTRADFRVIDIITVTDETDAITTRCHLMDFITPLWLISP